MSDERSRREQTEAAAEAEGWESLEEEAEASLAPNPELEEAMREAADAVEGRAQASAHARADAAAGPSQASEGARDQEVAALKDRLLRLQADFENYRKRMLREREESFQYGHENLVKDLLPTVDNLERAIEHVRQNEGADLEGLLRGVELVLRELQGALTKHGVTGIEALGEPFDPSVHEAMAQVPDGSVPPQTVVEVYEKGYRLRDRLLRPSRVLVSRRPDDGGEEKNEDGGVGSS